MTKIQTRRHVIAAIAALFGVILPIVSWEQVATGSTLTGAINQELNSKSAQVGQPFQLVNAHSYSSNMSGTVYGHVAQVQRAGAGTKAQIQLAVDRFRTNSGQVYQISGHVTNVQVNTKSNAGREAGAGAGGALIGGLLGGGWGAVIGGATGFLVAKNVHQDVTIPHGALVTVELNQVRRQPQ